MKEIKINGYSLDEQQLLPILENEPFSLILAGAGSGKTLTMIGKVKYLLEEKQYKPEEICCISFTNETVNNLKLQILKNCNKEIPVYTFHKLALLILDFYKEEFLIAPSNLLEEVIDDFFINSCYQHVTLRNAFFHLFSFTPFKTKKTWNKVLQSKEFKKAKRTIHTFLKLMKSNGYTKESFSDFFEGKKYKNFLFLIYTIYILYERKLKENHWIDFDDMMLLATDILRKKGCPFPFKHIIVDEFQDTSFLRFSLIQEIVKQNQSSFCVVGDDYQSIYHFSGCDLELFLHFQDYYPTAKLYKLEMTYRNSMELIQTASSFITKNPYQLKKNLQCNKSREKPIKIIFFQNQSTVLEKILKRISISNEILILGRNHFDIHSYTKNLNYTKNDKNYLEFEKFPNRRIKYLTIHAAKGLESDVVILLNVQDHIYGIPSKLKEEKILSLVKTKQSFPYEEERRLFYVALTRTKKDIFLLVPRENPSSFIKEIKKEKNVEILHFF